MSIRDQLLQDIADHPDDWSLRAIAADWAEDHGETNLAECLRWMIRHRKRPYRSARNLACWFDADRIDPGLGDPESDIPGQLFELLPFGEQQANHRIFINVRQAEEALYRAWHLARQSGWHG
jgi:uncharacterized protein (TIGR02996 family)